MNFDLDQDERELQRGIREICAGRFRLEEAAGFDRDLWRELADVEVTVDQRGTEVTIRRELSGSKPKP